MSKCPTCSGMVPSDAAYCPSCGMKMPSQPNNGEPVLCAGCGQQNRPGANYCQRCGRRFSPNAQLAADAAANAAAGKIVSSSGRDTVSGWGPRERADYLWRISLSDADARARAVPATSGDTLADLAAAEDHLTETEAAWELCDQELRNAEALKDSQVRSYSQADADVLAEVAVARQRSDVAWASRQSAKAHRDMLQRRYDGSDLRLLPDGLSER